MIADDKPYDVFLSYNRADRAVVEHLARRLEERDLRVFWDRSDLVPGKPWQEAIEAALGQSRSCVVVLGSTGESKWQNEEMRVAIDERIRTPSFGVIPLLLPGARYPLPLFLRRLTWVDFRNDLHDEREFERLVRGIRGLPPPAISGDPIPHVRTNTCPYMGLEAFKEEHAEFFFGREALSQRLVEELRESRFLAVVGPSGSGKSSVVLAGLIPALKKGKLPGSDRWRYLQPFRPGARPLEALALHLARLFPLPTPKDALDAVEGLENKLRQEKRTLHRTLQVLSAEAPDIRALLLIDQFEEVFTLCSDVEERQAFIRNLLSACEAPTSVATVILTLRADFYARATAELDLAPYLETRQVIVTPMTDEDFAQAIEAPALQVGLHFEAGLVERILGAVKHQPGGLPLLEHALFELWKRRSEDHRLTHDAYQQIGEVAEAVARRAEAEFGALSADQQLVARRVLIRLVEPGENAQDTRRRVRRSELIANDPGEIAAVGAVIDTLRTARLLTVGHHPASGEEVIEVAHEALIHEWQRLRDWLEEDRKALRIHRRIIDNVHEWVLSGREEEGLLQGILLDKALELVRLPRSLLSSLEQEYLAASVGRREREQAERLEYERRLAEETEARRKAEEQIARIVAASDLESGAMNRLLLDGVLNEREVLLLRSCSRYLVQAEAPFSQIYMEETVAGNPGIARNLVALFCERFDPRRGARSDAIREETGHFLAQIANIDEDRILRRFLNLIEATVRTNYFQAGPDGQPKSYLSLKIDSQAVDGLFSPRPFREIFVYSPRVEAIHLRGGKVARGGIRWSDRREDFRTEILDLMKMQMVKNAVIVPVGAKGGFVVKRPPPTGGREALQQEVIECYKIMMRGLLDLTDNLVGSVVVPPRDVVRRDGDDPYLVVAADKGTATFSDIANYISEEYGFWLGDAFASGGSVGYDHKDMAITSRGVWEGVRRHFREFDPPRDIDHEEFTCVGVGDMSGDVFGNGMLRSRFIKLLAAFDHRHIFVDPAPVPALSFEERLRLYRLPRSSWADYDRSLISPGGGVFARTLRSIPVTPEMARLFGLSLEEVTPSELIQAILRAPVDLLFFGGIGTFVKASSERHADAKDLFNDAHRVDARELRARIIGEGANLSLTQRARIEYAQAGGPDGTGGRINTDFIDNSAGVNCSDHEVNIKLLFNEIERGGRLVRDERDRLLAILTDEVAALVLRDNYLQTQAISVTHALGYTMLDRQARFMRALEREGRIDRRLDILPDEEELSDRARLRLGLTRPEIAVLLAYAKIALYDELLASDLPDDPFMQEDLKLYFPSRLRELYPEEIGRHRLSREIIATSATNSIVNRTGVAFIHEVQEKTGERAADISRAYVITREVFRLRAFWADVEALDNVVPASTQSLMLTEAGRLIDRAAIWFLKKGGKPWDIGSQIAVYAPGVQEIANNLDDLLGASDRVQLGARIAGLTDNGVPEGLARRAASLVSWLAPALDIVRIGREAGLPPLRIGRFYFGVGDRFGLDRIREAAAKLSRDKAIDQLAVSAIIDDLASLQAKLTTRILNSAEGQGELDTAIVGWVNERRPAMARAEQLMAELRAVDSPTMAMLVVVINALRALTDD